MAKASCSLFPQQSRLPVAFCIPAPQACQLSCAQAGLRREHISRSPACEAASGVISAPLKSDAAPKAQFLLCDLRGQLCALQRHCPQGSTHTRQLAPSLPHAGVGQTQHGHSAWFLPTVLPCPAHSGQRTRLVHVRGVDERFVT